MIFKIYFASKVIVIDPKILFLLNQFTAATEQGNLEEDIYNCYRNNQTK